MLIFLENIFRFVALLLVQVLVLNNIQFLGYINPYIYILFILMLPIRLPGWISLLLAFFTGLIVDAFSNTMGMHAFALVLVAFLRGGVIKLFTAIDEGNNPTPSFYTFDVSAFIKYVIVLVLIHEFTLFFLEAFTFVNFINTAYKALVNSAITIVILLGLMSIRNK